MRIIGNLCEITGIIWNTTSIYLTGSSISTNWPVELISRNQFTFNIFTIFPLQPKEAYLGISHGFRLDWVFWFLMRCSKKNIRLAGCRCLWYWQLMTFFFLLFKVNDSDISKEVGNYLRLWSSVEWWINNSLSALLLFLSDDSDISKDDQVGVFSFTFHCIISSFHSEIQ